MTDSLHPFERNQLGVAPFRYLRHERRVGPIKLGDGMTEIGSPGQPMGTCEHCGTGIADCFFIKSADGKIFYVGSDCVEKLYRESNKTATQKARDPIFQAIRKEKNRIAKEQRHAKEEKRIKEGLAFAEEHADELKAILTDRPGETQWDRLQWFMRNAGNSGKLKILKELPDIIADADVSDLAKENASKIFHAREVIAACREMDRRKAAHYRAAKAKAANLWLIKVIDQTPGDFCVDLSKRLRNMRIVDMSPRVIEVLQDIYAKQVGGRRNSKAYEKAGDEFTTLAGLE
jgi:hypothetical protein